MQGSARRPRRSGGDPLPRLNVTPLQSAVVAGRHARRDRAAGQIGLNAPRKDLANVARVVPVQPHAVPPVDRHGLPCPPSQLPITDVPPPSHRATPPPCRRGGSPGGSPADIAAWSSGCGLRTGPAGRSGAPANRVRSAAWARRCPLLTRRRHLPPTRPSLCQPLLPLVPSFWGVDSPHRPGNNK